MSWACQTNRTFFPRIERQTRRLNSRGSLPTAWVSVVFGMGAPDSELPAAFQEGTNVAGNPLIRVQTMTALNLGEMS